MSTKEERDLEEELGSSPWDLYADEDEPWTDLERLLKLEEKFDYQYEIAHVLGTSPSKISYWLDKAHNEVDIEPEETECTYHEICGNNSLGGKTTMCDECLDLVRYNDSPQFGERIDPEDADTMIDHMEALHEASEQ